MPIPDQEYGLTLVTPPAEEPVTRQEAKDFLRVDIEDDDALIDALIEAARAETEVFLRRQLVTATYDLFLDEFPGIGGRAAFGLLPGSRRLGRVTGPDAFGGIIWFPRPPLQSITSIQFFDPDGVLQAFALSNVIVDTTQVQGRVSPTREQFWPSTEIRMNAVQIRFVAGFGAASAVPRAIRTAILMLVADMYEHREAEIEVRLHHNKTASRLLWAHRVPRAA